MPPSSNSTRSWSHLSPGIITIIAQFTERSAVLGGVSPSFKVTILSCSLRFNCFGGQHSSDCVYLHLLLRDWNSWNEGNQYGITSSPSIMTVTKGAFLILHAVYFHSVCHLTLKLRRRGSASFSSMQTKVLLFSLQEVLPLYKICILFEMFWCQKKIYCSL